jgi:hypothetical protein
MHIGYIEEKSLKMTKNDKKFAKKLPQNWKNG